MTQQELLNSLLQATTSNAVADHIDRFFAANGEHVRWTPLGRDNNRGTVEAGGDPGRSLVERITNAMDAVLELQHDQHRGIPECRSPREAAHAWLGVPLEGLHRLSQAERQQLANRVALTIYDGDSTEHRTVDIRDDGIGLSKDELPHTILSLNESNKLGKFHVIGAYGQGGSSTFASSTYTLIISRRFPGTDANVTFSVVKYEDLPAERFKHGRYVYLSWDHQPLEAPVSSRDFPHGTLVRHYGYDLSTHTSALGPDSVYGLLQQILFDPVMPIWLDEKHRRRRRVIKGSRNALNGALDEGDEGRGPELGHHMAMYYVNLGGHGRLGIEYWVLASAGERKRPNAAFVDPLNPIVLTHNGQCHGDFPSSVIRKDAELPYLGARMVIHLDCNALTPLAKRNLFVSNREVVRSGEVSKSIREELVRALRSDEELSRLNTEAEQQGLRQRDEDSERQIRTEVARLLKTMGFQAPEPIGGAGASNPAATPARPGRPRPPRPPLEPIPVVDPPTFVEFVGEGPIKFYPGQRRYLRVRTNAPTSYHFPNDPERSRFNLILPQGLVFNGSTSLVGGRMRFIVEATSDTRIGSSGEINLELTRPGLEALRSSVSFQIVEMPTPAPTGAQISLPPFRVVPVAGPDDPQWTNLEWPDDVDSVASSAEMSGGVLLIHYSEQFPAFRQAKARFEQRSLPLAKTFVSRYEVWIAMHALLIQEDQRTRAQAVTQGGQSASGQAEEFADRQERCRLATLAATFASQEVQHDLAEQQAALTGDA